MSSWRECKLGEVVDIGSSKRIFYNEYVDYGIPFYRSKEIIEKYSKRNVSTELFITNDKFQEIKNKYGVPQEGDILLTSVGTLGIPYIVDSADEFYFKDGNLTWFKNFSQELFNLYLYYWIISPLGKNRLLSSSIGSTQSALTIQGLKNLDILLPSFNEQKAIANILSSLDKKIELLKEQNKTLETMAQTVFKEWFVNFNYPDATGEMVESEMGEIPKGWRVGILKDICETISKGTTPTKFDTEGLSSKVPFLKVKDITDDGKIKFDSLEKIPNEVHLTALKRSILMTNDILYSIAGTIGRVAILPNELNGSNCNQALAFIRLREKSKFLEYVHRWIQTDNIKNKINSSIVQGVQANVSLTVLGGLSIMIPDEQTLKGWNNIVKPIYKKILNNNLQIQTLETTRDALLPRLISGKLRIDEYDV